jgi:hypothetical protein
MKPIIYSNKNFFLYFIVQKNLTKQNKRAICLLYEQFVLRIKLRFKFNVKIKCSRYRLDTFFRL